MVKTLKESQPIEDLVYLHKAPSSRKISKADSRTVLKAETNLKFINDMKLSNQRSASLANLYSNRSQALISNGESVIIAERLSKLQNETTSPKLPNIFELTSPRNEGPSVISMTSGSILPSLGIRVSGGLKSKQEIMNDFQKKSVISKNVPEGIVKDVEFTKRRRSAIFNKNHEVIKDEADMRVGKNHRKIRLENNSHQPLFKFDQKAFDEERDQPLTTGKLPPGLKAFSTVLDHNTNEYRWEECSVIAKVAPGKYAIKWPQTSHPKIVDRLNLRYPEEMEQPATLDHERQRKAREMQYEALYNSNLKGSIV